MKTVENNNFSFDVGEGKNFGLTCCNLPANKPDSIVALIGVLVLGLISARQRKRRPSSAMAYNTRGRGNIAPRRDVERAKTAPTVTAHITAGQPS